MVVAYQLIDSQIQLEFLKSDEPFSRTFAPIAGFAKKNPAKDDSNTSKNCSHSGENFFTILSLTHLLCVKVVFTRLFISIFTERVLLRTKIGGAPGSPNCGY